MREKIIEAIKFFAGVSSDGSAGVAKNILTLSNSDLAVVNAIYGLIVPVATIALIAYWLDGYFEMTTGGREPSRDQITQTLIWLIVGFVVMQYVYYIVSQFAGINNVVLDDFSKALSKIKVTETEVKSMKDAFDGLNIILLVLGLVISIIAWIISLISNIVLVVTVLSTKIEILLRLALVPIGIAPLASVSYKGEAIRYLKKTLAAVFYGGVVLIVIQIATMSNANAIGNIGGGTSGEGFLSFASLIYLSLTGLVAPFAAIGAISTAKSIANEAFGG